MNEQVECVNTLLGLFSDLLELFLGVLLFSSALFLIFTFAFNTLTEFVGAWLLSYIV